jgi:biopolymer transport protein ExbD
MPRRRALPETEQPTQINIVPMIDVTFSILAFFIMSTLTLTKLDTIPVNLPKAQNSQIQSGSKASLSINEKGELFLNRQPIALSQLVDEIKQLQAPDQPLTVVLHGDRSINYGNAVEILDQVRQVPGVRIVIATKKP